MRGGTWQRLAASVAAPCLLALALACGAETPRKDGAGSAQAVGLDPRRPQTPKPPFPYVIEELESPSLSATLTIPAGAGPHPVVILISGTGIQDRDGTIAGHQPAWVLADHLSREGVAVLRYDDRGYDSLHGAAAEVWAARAALRERAEIDSRRLGLIGHSEGGVIAALVATEHPEDVAFVVLLASRGVTGSEVVVRQLGTLMAAAGRDAAAIEAEQATARRVHAAILARSSRDDPAALEGLLRASYDRLPEADRQTLGGPDAWIARQLETLGQPWFSEFLAWDPAPVLAGVRVPVLVVHGDRDTQVDAAQNLPPMRAALAANPAAEVLVFAGLNHLLQPATTGALDEYATIELTLDPKVLDAMTRWIEAREVD